MKRLPLTGQGERFEQPSIVRKVLCLVSDEDENTGILYVQDETNPYVIKLKRRLAANDFTFEVKVASSQEITKMYESDFQDSSSTQLTAKELFKLGAENKASDIHIIASKSHGTIFKMRLLGDLIEIPEMSCDFDDGNAVQSSIYQSMSQEHSTTSFEDFSFMGSRISDRKQLPDELDSIRVATGPLTDGLMMVLRLQYKQVQGSNLTDLGVPDLQKKSLEFLQSIPNGIVIVTGPTGAGKTTTLTVLMDMLIKQSEGKKHVLTVEDPAEYPIEGANQLKVVKAKDQDNDRDVFNDAVRGSLRLDPDMIMVGEIRDDETAKQAFRAAMTGHQVFTSLHSNNALGALARLMDLNVPDYLVSDPTILRGITAQRLVKTLCPHCKQKYTDQKDRYSKNQQERIDGLFDYEDAEKIFVANPEGCGHCTNGFNGRTLVIEVLVMDQALMSAIQKGTISALEYLNGTKQFQTMLDVALAKIKKGVIDPFEVEHHLGPLNLQMIEADHHIGSEEIRRNYKE